MSAGRREGGCLGVLRAAGLIAAVIGALGSVGLTIYAGRRNPSRLLLWLFVIWVLSPYAVLAAAEMISKHWTPLTRATLYGVMLVVVAASLPIYGIVALGAPRARPASVFLVVPPTSWVVIAVVVPIAARISGRVSGRGDGG
jgi:hypothetical protein